MNGMQLVNLYFSKTLANLFRQNNVDKDGLTISIKKLTKKNGHTNRIYK